MMFRPTNPHDYHQTEVELREWQRQRDEKKDDFPVIRLADDEMKLLEEIESAEDFVVVNEKNKSRAVRLRDFDFIEIKRIEHPEKGSVEFCEIRKRGTNYLNYVRDEHKREKRAMLHDWKIAAFSALAGALLSEPLWSVIRSVVSALKE